MAKSADAFRTISEVADWLGVPAHVLRFWESRFSQVKPVKRAGGRRYYRPADMQLLGGISKLLHDDGMTIKGVQKVLREHGIKHVAALSGPLETDLSGIALDVEPESAKVFSFQQNEAKPAPPEPKADAPEETTAPEASAPGDATDDAPAPDDPTPLDDKVADTAAKDTPDTPEPDAAPDNVSEMPSFLRRPLGAPEPADQPRPEVETQGAAPDIPAPDAPAAPPPSVPAAPRPTPLTTPDDPGDEIAAPSGRLAALAALRRPVDAAQRARLETIAGRLRDIANPRPDTPG